MYSNVHITNVMLEAYQARERQRRAERAMAIIINFTDPDDVESTAYTRYVEIGTALQTLGTLAHESRTDMQRDPSYWLEVLFWLRTTVLARIRRGVYELAWEFMPQE